MNTNKNVLFRYLLIDRRLREEPNAGIEDLKSYVVEHSKSTINANVLTSTIKTDIKNMRKHYFTPIEFSFGTNHYYYNIPNYTFLKLPTIILDALIQKIKLQYQLGKRFNDENTLEVTNTIAKKHIHLPVIISAISNNRVLKFIYKSVNAKRGFDYNVHPYLVKEHLNNLYLVGIKDGEKEFRIFMLDGIIGVPTITGIEAKRGVELEGSAIKELFSKK
jgi:predicted DNA-binding transcriptional regulator YafY